MRRDNLRGPREDLLRPLSCLTHSKMPPEKPLLSAQNSGFQSQLCPSGCEEMGPGLPPLSQVPGRFGWGHPVLSEQTAAVNTLHLPRTLWRLRAQAWVRSLLPSGSGGVPGALGASAHNGPQTGPEAQLPDSLRGPRDPEAKLLAHSCSHGAQRGARGRDERRHHD